MIRHIDRSPKDPQQELMFWNGVKRAAEMIANNEITPEKALSASELSIDFWLHEIESASK